MRLQLLGDLRDAFKWSCLHYLMTCDFLALEKLVVIPMLREDEPHMPEGNCCPTGFPCQERIQEFLRELRVEPRSLDRIGLLGSLTSAHFPVEVVKPTEVVRDSARESYWRGLEVDSKTDSLVFLDPDNGFEPGTANSKHLRFAEIKALWERLPQSSCMVVYQHKRRQPWATTIAEITARLEGIGIRHVLTVTQDQVTLFFLPRAGELALVLQIALTTYRELHSGIVVQ